MSKRINNNILKFYSFLSLVILIGVVLSACEIQDNTNEDSANDFEVTVPELPEPDKAVQKVNSPKKSQPPEDFFVPDGQPEEIQAPEEIPEELPAEVPVPEEIPEVPGQAPQAPVTSQFTIPPLGGNTYYVSTSGNNANPGTMQQPWATLSYAVSQLHPGDTLIIRGGRYVLSDFGEDILRPGSGTANAWIAIKGEEGHRPILAGRNNLLTAIDLPDARYVWIDNLEITSDNGAQFRDGIEGMSGNLESIILSNLYIHHLDEFGINIADVNNLKILNSQVLYAGLSGVGGPEGQYGGWRNVLIKGSSLSYNGHYYQGKIGPSPFDRPDGFGIEPSDGPIEIADTIAEHNLGDGLDSKARNTYIHDCTVANNFADGIKLWGTGSKVENCLIYGRGDGNPASMPWASVVIDTTDDNANFEFNYNTLDSEAEESGVFAVQYDFNEHPITLTMKNNIFSSRGNRAPMIIKSNVDYTAEGNVFWFPNSDYIIENGDRQFTSANIGQLGSGNVYGNPLFVQTGFGVNGDYHLQSNSPAKNAGKVSLR